MSNFRIIALRVLATFAYNAMAVIGSASIVGGIPVWKAALLSGVAATAQVIQKLARAYADDGNITEEDVKAAFTGSAKDGEPEGAVEEDTAGEAK